MYSTGEPTAKPNDAALLARIATMRESVRGHKQRALAMWNACLPETQPEVRPTMGNFTEKLVHCE